MSTAMAAVSCLCTALAADHAHSPAVVPGGCYMHSHFPASDDLCSSNTRQYSAVCIGSQCQSWAAAASDALQAIKCTEPPVPVDQTV